MVAYFAEAPAADAAWAVFFLTGRRLKRLVSYPAIHQWTLAATGLEGWLVEECYAVVGDGAETVALVLDQVAVETGEDMALSEWVEQRILPLRELDDEAQRQRVIGWWSCLDRLQRFMLLKKSEASLCHRNPGFPEPVCVRGPLTALVAWWRGPSRSSRVR